MSMAGGTGNGRGAPAWMAAVMAGALAAAGAPHEAGGQEARGREAGPPAAASEQRRFDIAPQPLTEALIQFGRQAGLQVSAESELVRGRRTQGVQGTMTRDQALATLLAETGLTYRINGAMVALERADGQVFTLDAVRVEARRSGGTGQIGPLPAPYAGGQVARGGQVGLLGNRDIMDTPFSMTSYTEKVIQDQQAKSLADALVHESSIRVDWSSRGGYSDSFTLRGFNVAAGDVAFGGLFGVAPRTFTSLEGIERVEVLRGMSGLLNGVSPGGSIGGVINLVPKRAGDEPLTEFTTSYESDGYVQGHADIGRRFGPDKALGVRLNAVYGKGDTAIDHQGAKILNLAAGVDYQGDGFRLSGDLGYLKRRSEAPMRLANIGAGLTAIPDAPKAGTNYAQRWTYVDLESLHGTARAEVDIAPAVTAYVAAGFRRNPTDLLVSVPGLTGSNGDFTERNLYFFDDVNSETAEAGLRADLAMGAVRHQLALSASAIWQARYNITHTVSTGPSNIYDPVRVPKPDLSGYDTDPELINRQRFSGIAIADTISILDEAVQLTLGLRHQQVKNVNYAGGAVSSRYKENATSPAAALVVRPTKWMSLYASYIQGLAPGPIAPAGTANQGEAFPPYVSKQYEAGMKFDLGKFGLTLAVFQMTQPSGFSTPSDTGGLPTYGVDGRQRNRGVEVNGFGEIVEGLRLLGGFMVLDAVQVKTVQGATDGRKAIGAPGFQANLGLEWDVPFVAGLTLGANVVHTGRQYVNASNSLRIPAWTRVDLGAAYQFEVQQTPITVRARVTNLFDEGYWASASVFGGALAMGAPRTIALSTMIGF